MPSFFYGYILPLFREVALQPIRTQFRYGSRFPAPPDLVVRGRRSQGHLVFVSLVGFELSGQSQENTDSSKHARHGCRARNVRSG